MPVSTSSTPEMLAVVKTGKGPENVVVMSVPVPVAAQGMTRVRVLATGICGTDVHIARDEYRYEAPVILGHEVLGLVDADGSDLPGKRVTVETYYSTCGACDWCRSGRTNLCPSRRSIGSFENGAFASYVVVPEMNLHALPDFLDDIEGVLSEPLACVAHCLLDPPVISAGDKVLVTGPGTIGQLAAQVARAAGGSVTLSGLPSDQARLQIATDLGLATTTDLPEAEAFDVVIECSGSAAGATAALRAARRGGRYVQVGIFGKDVTLPVDLVLYKELVVTSGFASTPASWRRAMALIEQRLVTLSPLVTHRAGIRDWDDAFAAAAAGQGLKTVIVPD